MLESLVYNDNRVMLTTTTMVAFLSLGLHSYHLAVHPPKRAGERRQLSLLSSRLNLKEFLISDQIRKRFLGQKKVAVPEPVLDKDKSS